MSPETRLLLNKAHEFLTKSDGMLASGWPDEAGRAAYYAGLQAARALISERTERAVKTHAGVRTEFLRLIRDDAHFDDEVRSFLGRTYDFKIAADYDAGTGARVTVEQARAAMVEARRLVAVVEAVLNVDGPDQLSSSESQ